MTALAPEDWQAVRLSVQVALWATVLGLGPAFGLAWVLARRRFPGHALLNALVHLPLVLPPVVTGYILLATLGRTAPLGRALEACCGVVLAFRWTGAVLAAVLMALPLMVRAMRLAIEAVDPKLEEAAAVLGVRPALVFLTVTLPLALPGLIAGALLCFAKAMGEFGATITFVAAIPGETLTLPSAIHARLQVPGGEGAVLWLSALSLAISFAALMGSEALAVRMQRRIAGRVGGRDA